MLDLKDPAVRDHFGIDEADFFSAFRTESSRNTAGTDGTRFDPADDDGHLRVALSLGRHAPKIDARMQFCHLQTGGQSAGFAPHSGTTRGDTGGLARADSLTKEDEM